MKCSDCERNGGNEHCHGQLGQDVRETMSIKVGRMTFKQSNLQPGQVKGNVKLVKHGERRMVIWR